MPSWYICGNERYRGPVLSGGGIVYDVDAQAWFTQVSNAGGSVTDLQKGRVNTLILSLKGHSLFSANSRLWIHAGESDTKQATIDIMGLVTATNTGSVPFGATGYGPGNAGSTRFIDYNTNPSNFNPNSDLASFGFSVSNSGTGDETTVTMGYFDAGIQLTDAIVKAAASQGFRPMNGTQMTWANGQRKGIYILSRRAVVDVEIYKDGISVVTSSAGHLAGTVKNFYGCARNDNGTANAGNTLDVIGTAWIGGPLTTTDMLNLNNDIQAYLTAWGV